MRLFRKLIGFLSCFIFPAISCTVHADSAFLKQLSPLSHNYTSELLSRVRAVQPQINALPPGVRPFLHRLSILPVAFDGVFLYPWMIVNLGSEMQGIPRRDNDVVANTAIILDSLRGNLIIGNVYKYSPYLRVGYDFIPLGYPIFDTRVPRGVLARVMLNKRNTILEVGGSYSNMHGTLQGSLVFCVDCKFPILNGQYERKKSIHKIGFLSIDHYKIGGGIGSPFNTSSMLFNFYSSIDFLKTYNLRLEYVYNSLFNKIEHDDFRVSKLDPHAFHLELSKRFARLPIPFFIIGGYEKGLANTHNDLISDLFGAVKLELINQRIMLVIGAKWDCLRNNLYHLFRIDISID